MSFTVSSLALAIDRIILAVVLAYSYGMIAHWSGHLMTKQIIMGAVMGAATLFAMMSPIEFSTGVIVDTRTLIVALSAAFFGVIGAAIAGLAGIAMRIYVGGTGMIAGITTIAVSADMGLVWFCPSSGFLGPMGA